MEFRAAETLILNNEEFILLLSAAGISGWYGIELSGDTGFANDDIRLNGCIAGLYRKGLIEWGESKARVSDNVRPVFDVLRSAPVCITSTNLREQNSDIGSYCSDGRVVISERSLLGTDEIKLTLMSADEWISMFEKGGYLPKVMEAPPDMDAEHMFPENGDLISEFAVRSIPDGKLLEKLMLFDCGTYGMIIQNSRTFSMREMFTMESIKEIMRSWAGGKSQ
ncbi:MAG: hypothetical protein IKG17_06540 [Mogibacterium sp.]|nr:hypothetical protein [Mogibacterium sp.]